MSRLFPVPSAVSRWFFHPAWDIYDRSVRLIEAGALARRTRGPIDMLRARQWERVRRIVRYAHEHCDYYRDRGPLTLTTREDFARLPLLPKEDVRHQLDRLISREFDRAALVSSKTGGSTGLSLTLYFDRRCQERRNAAQLHTNGWSGWRPGDPVGALWGNPPEARTFRERMRAACLDRLVFLDTVRLDDRSLQAFRDQLVESRIHFLFGHAHSLYLFARYLEGVEHRGLDIRGIVSTSMMLLPAERAVIERVFGCRMIDRYGCEEVGLIACQCERGGGLHLNMEHLLVEILRADGRPAAPGEEGEVVVTDLINRGMPLIRYRVGDMAVPAADPCPCGRTWPLLERVTGRTADFLVARDGSRVAGVSLVERTLTAIPGLEQLQIVQESRERIVLNVVPDSGFDAAAEAELVGEMRRAMGEGIDFEVRRLTRLEQERNGKYRFAICRVDPA